MKPKHFFRTLTRKLWKEHNATGISVLCMDGSKPHEMATLTEVKSVKPLRVKGPEINRRTHLGAYLYELPEEYKTPDYYVATVYDQDEDSSFIFVAQEEHHDG